MACVQVSAKIHTTSQLVLALKMNNRCNAVLNEASRELIVVQKASCSKYLIYLNSRRYGTSWLGMMIESNGAFVSTHTNSVHSARKEERLWECEDMKTYYSKYLSMSTSQVTSSPTFTEPLVIVPMCRT